MDDAQHDLRSQNPQSASGSIDSPGTNVPLPRRPANDATPEARTGSTPPSPDRAAFLRTMSDRARFPSLDETERWAQAVFNALRHHALEQDPSLLTEFSSVVKVGEAPEVQVREMLWGGNFTERMLTMASYLGSWDRAGLDQKVADEAGVQPGDPWIDAAVTSFFGALKVQAGDDADHSLPALGALQPLWDQA